MQAQTISKSMRTLTAAVILAAGIFAVAVVLARDSAPVPTGEAERLADRAAFIAQSCATCHGTEGRLETAIPSIAGKPEAVLQAQLLAFKRDQMPGATVMPRLAKGYSEEELEAIARYFSSIQID